MNLIKTYKNFAISFSALFALTFGYSQDNSSCGFIPTEENIKYFNSIKSKTQELEQEFLQNRQFNRFSNNLSSIPIKAHIIRSDNGTGGLSESQLNQAIATMNEFYANAGLQFFVCSAINYIDNSNFYNFEMSTESSLTSANNVDDVINIYFANSIVNTQGNNLCGYAYYPGGPETVLMTNSCTLNGSTLAHELGHFFGLFHTHGNSNTPGATTELVNGSNCDDSGDFICDTPADPVLSSSNVNSSCNYSGSAQDANNDTYNPDAENVMSYSRKSCRTLFSDEQYARINSVYQTSRSNLTCSTFNADFAANVTESCEANLTVNFTESSEGATSWSWDIDGDGIEDYNQRNITHTYTTPGNFDVALTITDGNNTISKVKSNYIDVGADEVETSEIKLILKLDNWPSETSWNFMDGDGNSIASGGPYTNSDKNETKRETFNVNSNLCYSFEILDSYGDGLASSSFYELRDEDDNLIAQGRDFDSSEKSNFYTGSLLSTNELSKEDISLFPNPTSGNLNIRLVNGQLPETVTVYNTLGQNLIKKLVSSEQDLILSTEGFNSGLYFVKLESDRGELIMRFVKN